MEINNKVKDLEDELKVLKSEIRNVLLDIREVILDKTNPLTEEHESAFIRMDLNTTARAMAAEAAAREAARGAEPSPAPPETPAGEPHGDHEAEAADEAPASKGPDDVPPTEHGDEAESPVAQAGPPRRAPATEIPPMYRASIAPSSGAVGLAAWVADAMAEIGPEPLDRVITIHRLCGTLPPNLSEALAHVQELIRSSDGEMPWLKVLQDLDRLASG